MSIYFTIKAQPYISGLSSSDGILIKPVFPTFKTYSPPHPKLNNSARFVVLGFFIIICIVVLQCGLRQESHSRLM